MVWNDSTTHSTASKQDGALRVLLPEHILLFISWAGAPLYSLPGPDLEEQVMGA